MNKRNVETLVSIGITISMVISWTLLTSIDNTIRQEAMATIATIPIQQTTENAATNTSIQNTTTDITSLGDPFYTERTKATSIRVIDVINGPKVEVSFSGNGTIRDSINVTDIGTIWTLPVSGGMIYSEGQGLLTTQQGEMATYTQKAIGQITPEGRVVFHGSMFFKTLSPIGQFPSPLASLDNQMGIYNYESDIAGNAIRQVWEWQ
ncbi:MAG TPA: hypothetical protein VE445_09035 [Nitrososphaeraceae archaeon]|nr:hypothetical protein [Nitrososphaeraceae archaeon]